jgi:hypothetical protein
MRLHRSFRLPTALLLATAPVALACAEPPPMDGQVPRAQDAQERPPPDLSWLEGHWCGTQGEARIEELWLARGDLMLNLGTTMRGGELVGFEYTRIEARAGGVVFVAQPGGVPPVEFALVESGPRRIAFANPAHDFPTRVAYWRDEAGLHAEIAGPGEEGEQRIAFDYVACPEEDASPL